MVVVVSAATTAAGRAAEVAVERRHVLGIARTALSVAGFSTAPVAQRMKRNGCVKIGL